MHIRMNNNDWYKRYAKLIHIVIAWVLYTFPVVFILFRHFHIPYLLSQVWLVLSLSYI